MGCHARWEDEVSVLRHATNRWRVAALIDPKDSGRSRKREHEVAGGERPQAGVKDEQCAVFGRHHGGR